MSGVDVLLGDDVSKVVLDCLNNFHIHFEFNHTYVTLVPKVKSPEERISKFRPIRSCNVIYKLVSKVLANRMKKLLSLVVFENQSAFQAGQVVTNNLLTAFDNLYYMKNHQYGKPGFMALKLNTSKEYEQVEWSFLECLLSRMGFHSRSVL